LPLEQPSFADRLQAVETRVCQAAERAGRKRADVKLVAVSKKFSADHLREAYQNGVRDFGENYVQEFAGKKPFLADLTGVCYHLIGNLQSNKARVACDLFDVIQTIDSTKTLTRLNAVLEEQARTLPILLEIKLSSEASKTGASPEQIPELMEAAKLCPAIHLTGLMTIPPWSADPESARPYFQSLAKLASRHGLRQLSMGMSADFEVAIEEGATIVRVGTALFGPRPKPAQIVPAEP
jgi:pyridoxal phosphate enzyme (YggS family)